MRLRLVMTAVGFVMSSAALVACGEDTPAVCGSAEQLQSSFDDLKDIDITEENGPEEFKSQVETVDGDLDQLTNDAKAEFSSQVDTVIATFEALKTSAQAATDDPSAAHPGRGQHRDVRVHHRGPGPHQGRGVDLLSMRS